MTYPNYPQPGQQPAYPPQQQPVYPPQQPVYPPQTPSYPHQGPAYYPPPQQPAYAPPEPQVRGTIDDFYDQPAASGKSIAGWFQTPGQSITGIVARDLTDADTRPQTDMQTKQPKFYADRRPMLTMTIPLLVQPSPDFPDGRAAYIINSSDKEDLDIAMQAAGCPPRSVPRKDDVITITFTGFKQIPGFGVPKKVKRIEYRRGANANGYDLHAAPAPLPQTAPAPAPAPQYQAPQYQAPQYAPPAPQYAPQQPPFQAPYQPQPDPTQYATAPAPGAAPATPAPPATAASPQQYAAPDNLTPEQAERLRQLTGGQ